MHYIRYGYKTGVTYSTSIAWLIIALLALLAVIVGFVDPDIIVGGFPK